MNLEKGLKYGGVIADYALVFMFLDPVSTIQAFPDIIVQGTLLSNTLGESIFVHDWAVLLYYWDLVSRNELFAFYFRQPFEMNSGIAQNIY